MPQKQVILLEDVMGLKGGENGHQGSELLEAVDQQGRALAPNFYSQEHDLGANVRKKGWTNIGDISACLKTTFGLGQVYQDSKTPHIVVASKHTRPVVIANGQTQMEAMVKAIAGDLNSPFGGFFGLNTPLESDTAEFLDRMFIEGVIAPAYEEGTVERLSLKENRFLIETGELRAQDLYVFERGMQLVAGGKFLIQDPELPFNVNTEAAVVTGNEGNPDIISLDQRTVNDIRFAGNAALYLASNLIFLVSNGAIAGLGDGCGARTVAAEKARRMLENSAYAALSRNHPDLWAAVLYDTPFTESDFKGIIDPTLKITAFSDAFFPKLDGFVETTGLDRINMEIANREYVPKGKDTPFIPKKNNYDSNYDRGLIPLVVVQPGGSLGDKVTLPLAEQYGQKMVLTMTPEIFQKYQAGEKATGRRFFQHIIM